MIEKVRFSYSFTKKDKQRIMDLIKIKNSSIRKIAKDLGISHSYLHAIINGKSFNKKMMLRLTKLEFFYSIECEETRYS